MKKFILIVEMPKGYDIADIAKVIGSAEDFDANYIKNFLIDINIKAILEIEKDERA